MLFVERHEFGLNALLEVSDVNRGDNLPQGLFSIHGGRRRTYENELPIDTVEEPVLQADAVMERDSNRIAMELRNRLDA
jgi:hypothetical protein